MAPLPSLLNHRRWLAALLARWQAFREQKRWRPWVLGSGRNNCLQHGHLRRLAERLMESRTCKQLLDQENQKGQGKKKLHEEGRRDLC